MSEIINSEVVSEIFKKMKEKNILDNPIDVKLEKNINNVIKTEINDYIDQFVYYRLLRGYTQDQVGQAIGISCKAYYKYEKRIHKLIDIDKINKIADFLEIKEDLLNVPLIEKIDNQQLKEYLKNKNINNSEFSKLIGVSRRTVVDWFNQNVEISEENCKKIKKFLYEYDNEDTECIEIE